jgi:hypothetical protein
MVYGGKDDVVFRQGVQDLVGAEIKERKLHSDHVSAFDVGAVLKQTITDRESLLLGLE